jgi:hypothetical protein
MLAPQEIRCRHPRTGCVLEGREMSSRPIAEIEEEQRRINMEAIRKGAMENPMRAPVRTFGKVRQHDAPHDERPRLRGIDFGDMRPRLDVPAIIRDLLAPDSMAAILGASGAGKTFFSVDMACRIASGLPFFGRKVNRGLVVYAALEGAGSAQDRFAAWKVRYKSDAIPLRAMIEGINLRDPVDQLRLVQFIREAESDHGEKCSAVFFDTLSRAIAGGNENAPDDMGALVQGGDAVRMATGACVIFVHHHGKDETKGGRGHSSLRCALDTEIEVSIAGDERIAKVTKQRDWPTGDRFGFKLETVELGTNVDDVLITSCVIKECSAPVEARPEMKGKAQRQLLAAIRARNTANQVWTLEAMRTAGRESGLHKNTARAAVDAVAFSPFMTPTVGGYRLNE